MPQSTFFIFILARTAVKELRGSATYEISLGIEQSSLKNIQSLPTLLKALTSLWGVSCKRETYDRHLRVFPSAIISWVSFMYHAVSMLCCCTSVGEQCAVHGWVPNHSVNTSVLATRPCHWPVAIPITNKTSYSHPFANETDLRMVRLSDKYCTSYNYNYFLDFSVFDFSDA
jgi:hypothetical protein